LSLTFDFCPHAGDCGLSFKSYPKTFSCPTSDELHHLKNHRSRGLYLLPLSIADMKVGQVISIMGGAERNEGKARMMQRPFSKTA
jgi:hypothetical protein